MPHRLLNIDLQMVLLNTTSVGVLAMNWFSEHMTGAGGFIVMISIAALNFAKAYKEFKRK